MNEADREYWLEQRRSGLGGTDISALVGLNPYRKPIDVYLDKRGLTEDIPQNGAMMWGLKQEGIIADHYAELHGVKLYEPGFMVSSEHSWLTGTPDRMIEGDCKGLEIKTASSRVAHKWGDSGTDNVPDEHLIQCQWYMTLTGCRVWDLAVKIDSADYREYTITHNPKLEKKLIDIAEDFWNRNVLAGVAPGPDGSDRYVEYIKNTYPTDTGRMIPETPELYRLASRYVLVKKDFKRLEAEKNFIENTIKGTIGQARGVDGAGWKATWRSSKPVFEIDYAAALDYLKENGVSEQLIAAAVKKSKRSHAGERRFYFKPSDAFEVSAEMRAKAWGSEPLTYAQLTEGEDEDNE